jgi:hypothetical protein
VTHASGRLRRLIEVPLMLVLCEIATRRGGSAGGHDGVKLAPREDECENERNDD